jgi:hypothetical protein
MGEPRERMCGGETHGGATHPLVFGCSYPATPLRTVRGLIGPPPISAAGLYISQGETL